MPDFFAKAVKSSDILRFDMPEDPSLARSLKHKWAYIWARHKWLLPASTLQAIFVGSLAATNKQVSSILRVAPSHLPGGGLGVYLGKACRCPANHVLTIIRGEVILATKHQTLTEQKYTWTMKPEKDCKYAFSQAGNFFNITKYLNSSQGTNKPANVRIEWLFDGLLGLVCANFDIPNDNTELIVDYAW